MSHYNHQGGPARPYDAYDNPQQHYYADPPPHSHSGYDSHSYQQQHSYPAAYETSQPEYQAAPVKPQR